ncbi:hypothetical protein KI387_004369, partial [Taxus chinensis]
MGQKYAAGAKFWFDRENRLTAERVAFATSETRVREPAEPGEMSQGSPKNSGTRGSKVREP